MIPMFPAIAPEMSKSSGAAKDQQILKRNDQTEMKIVYFLMCWTILIILIFLVISLIIISTILVPTIKITNKVILTISAILIILVFSHFDHFSLLTILVILTIFWSF